MATEFEIASDQRDAGGRPVRVLSLKGELDAHTMRTLLTELERQAKEDAEPRVVLDCGELEYVSSAGLGVLNKMTKEFRDKDGDLRLAALNEKIASIVDLLGFNKVIGVHDTVDEALEAHRA